MRSSTSAFLFRYIGVAGAIDFPRLADASNFIFFYPGRKMKITHVAQQLQNKILSGSIRAHCVISKRDDSTGNTVTVDSLSDVMNSSSGIAHVTELNWGNGEGILQANGFDHFYMSYDTLSSVTYEVAPPVQAIFDFYGKFLE